VFVVGSVGDGDVYVLPTFIACLVPADQQYGPDLQEQHGQCGQQVIDFASQYAGASLLDLGSTVTQRIA